jgi:hypothetical protein
MLQTKIASLKAKQRLQVLQLQMLRSQAKKVCKKINKSHYDSKQQEE